MKILVTDQQGEEHALEALEGWRVMEIIRDWGLDVKAECGGACACATCHVFVDSKWVGRLVPALAEEENMLDNTVDAAENSRLSCQLLMRQDLDGLKVTLAPSAARDQVAA